MTDDDRVLTFKDLKTKKGWSFSADHTRRLVREGKFPKPFKTSSSDQARNQWLESEIDAYLSGRAKSVRGAE